MARKSKSLDPRNFKGRSDAEIIQTVTEDMRRAVTFQQPFFDKFARFFQQYQCIHENMRADGSNLFIPYIYNIIETALPKILASVIETKRIISYKPVGPGDDEKAEMLTNLVAYQMTQKMKAATRFYEIYKCAILYGTAISKQTWKYKEKVVTAREMQDFEVLMDDGTTVMIPMRAPAKKKKVIYDAPDMKNIPIESFFFDPAYSDVDDSPFCIHEYFRELYELRQGEKEGYYKNTAKISEEPEDGARKSRYDSSGVTLGEMSNGVRIWEYWTDDWLVTIANKDTVIRVEENPYFHGKKPFIRWVTVPMPNEFYGKSMVEALTDLQAELNTVRNQRVDNVSLALNRMFLIAKGSGIDVDQLKSRPNGFIEVEDVEKDIKELAVQDVTSSAYRDEEIIKTDMDVTSGVHNHDRGQAGERRETATTATLLSSASSERFRLQILMMEEDSLTELGRQLAELNKQFLDDETYILITGEGGDISTVPVSFEDIDVEYDVMASGTATDATVNKEVRKGQLIQLMSTAVNNPYINQPALLKEIFKEFDFKNFEDLIIEQPAPAQGEETPVDAATAGQTGGEPEGLYPQMGGVGQMGQYLQEAGVPAPTV